MSQPNIDVLDAVRTRRSIRAYKKDSVELSVLESIMTRAGYAPSGSNLQPWHVHVLTGQTLQRVGGRIQSAFLNEEKSHRAIGLAKFL